MFLANVSSTAAMLGSDTNALSWSKNHVKKTSGTHKAGRTASQCRYSILGTTILHSKRAAGDLQMEYDPMNPGGICVPIICASTPNIHFEMVSVG